MVESKKFSELTAGDIFVYDNWQFEYKIGIYDGKEYNARCVSTGELWFFNDEDNVLFMKEKEDEN